MSHERRCWGVTPLALVVLTLLGSCSVREIDAPAWGFEERIATVLDAKCAGCHGPELSEAGWRADSFLGVIGCPSTVAASAVLPPNETAPILAVLERDDHRELLSSEERTLLTEWVRQGAPARTGDAHHHGFADPRSPEFHGEQLRRRRWAPMVDRTVEDACWRCHEADRPGATPCGSCHEGPQGPLSCGTCHGEGARDYFPRDPCFYPDDPPSGGHRVHVDSGSPNGGHLPCAACHGLRDLEGLMSGPHGDGRLDLLPEVGFDAATGRCASRCHDRGGPRPDPGLWGADDVEPVVCGDCHPVPPADHAGAPCNVCHGEVDPLGLELRPGPRHGNGVVEPAEGTEECGACHGAGDDPWPTTGAHAAHRMPDIAAEIACETCHAVPGEVGQEGHLDDGTPGPEVVLTGPAAARGATPSFSAGRCTSVACHGFGVPGSDGSTPQWSSRDGRCEACHGLPPAPPHSAETRCGAPICHGGAVERVFGSPRLTEAGLAQHIDGVAQGGSAAP